MKYFYKNILKICPAIHIENINDWKNELIKSHISITSKSKIGLTAGASTDRQELITLKNIIENTLKSI